MNVVASLCLGRAVDLTCNRSLRAYTSPRLEEAKPAPAHISGEGWPLNKNRPLLLRTLARKRLEKRFHELRFKGKGQF